MEGTKRRAAAAPYRTPRGDGAGRRAAVAAGRPPGGPARRGERITVTTADGVRLSGVHLPRPGATALVVCHGFTHHTAHPTTRPVLAALATRAAVVAVDLRGHGRSAGRSTVGDRELHDLDAAVGWARAAGYSRVVSVGFSLGAAVAIRQGALGSSRPDAVVAVSAPARWYSRETAPMRRVHWLLEQPHGRAVARMLGVRLDRPWPIVPASPVELAAAVAPLPLLLVAFAGDRYFSPGHAEALAAGYRDGGAAAARLWVEPGSGHGESGTSAPLAVRIAAWADDPDGPPCPPGGRPAGGSTVEGDGPAPGRAAGSEDG